MPSSMYVAEHRTWSSSKRLICTACDTGLKEPKWKLLATLSGHHSRTIFSVDWSADNLIATGEAAARSLCLSVRRFYQLYKIKIAGSQDNGIRVFRQVQQSSAAEPSSAPSYDQAIHLEDAHTADVNCVQWHPQDATLLASAGDDGSVKLWRIQVRGGMDSGLVKAKMHESS